MDFTPQFDPYRPLPHNAEDLLERLREAHPLKNPAPDATYGEMQRAAGVQDVLIWLETRIASEEQSTSGE